MKLYSTYGIVGDIIFQNKDWTIGRINEGAFGNLVSGDLDPQSILDACRVRGVVHTNGRLSEYFAPKECGFLAISHRPFDYNLSAKDVKAIADTAASAGMGDPITRFSAICQEQGGKFDARDVFNTAHIKDGKLVYASSQLNPSGPLHYKDHRGNFTVSNPESNKGEATGICFSNHFEMIYVPFGDDHEKVRQCISRVMERANAQGRLASDYIVIPVIWDEPQACIRVRQLPTMTAKEMLAYFGGGKAKGNKMETLSSCLEHLASKVPFMEVGDVHYVQINTQPPETPVEVEPTDWLLARAAHFEVIHSDQPEAEAVDMFVRVVDKPCDDFAAALYTMFEAQKKPISVVGLSAQKIDKLFGEIKKRVNDASNV